MAHLVSMSDGLPQRLCLEMESLRELLDQLWMLWLGGWRKSQWDLKQDRFAACCRCLHQSWVGHELVRCTAECW